MYNLVVMTKGWKCDGYLGIDTLYISCSSKKLSRTLHQFRDCGFFSARWRCGSSIFKVVDVLHYIVATMINIVVN